MKGIVSVLKFPDNNVYRVQIVRFVNECHKVNTYVRSYKDLKKVSRLSYLSNKIEKLLSVKIIMHRYMEAEHKNYITHDEQNTIMKGLGF